MEAKHTTKPSQNRWGSLYVIASVMGSALGSGWISPEVAGGQWLAMVVYVTGLMTQTNITATNLAKEIGEVSHDAISRMLAGASWSLTVGICLAIRVIEPIGGEGWLIVDDVLIPKVFCREIAFCGWDHDHTHNRTVFGQRLVFVVWSNGWMTLPVAFAFWQQDPNRKPKPKKKGGKRGWPKGKKRVPVRQQPTPTDVNPDDACPTESTTEPKTNWRGFWCGRCCGVNCGWIGFCLTTGICPMTTSSILPALD